MANTNSYATKVVMVFLSGNYCAASIWQIGNDWHHLHTQVILQNQKQFNLYTIYLEVSEEIKPLLIG